MDVSLFLVCVKSVVRTAALHRMPSADFRDYAEIPHFPQSKSLSIRRTPAEADVLSRRGAVRRLDIRGPQNILIFGGSVEHGGALYKGRARSRASLSLSAPHGFFTALKARFL